MNARIPTTARALPPVSPGQFAFACRLGGVDLDCVIGACEDYGIEVLAIWHAGVDIAELLAQSLDSRIEEAWEQHCEEHNTGARIERAIAQQEETC